MLHLLAGSVFQDEAICSKDEAICSNDEGICSKRDRLESVFAMIIRTLLVAPNAFRGSLTAMECARAMAAGARDALPEIKAILHPLSDGGDGLLEVLAGALDAEIITTGASGPLPGQRVNASWVMSRERRMAIIEMARVAGLTLVPEARRDPRITTTYGVGQLILEAMNRGASSIIIGIGGSATNDGGAGMAQALGVRFLDDRGEELPRGGAALRDLARLDLAALDPRVKGVRFTVACDVENPLVGDHGASVVFGPQKGASPRDVTLLDAALRHYGQLVSEACGQDVLNVPGAGAAGGLGAGLLAFCHAELKRGIDIVLDATGFDEALAAADLVITGEGKIDAQTRFGKAPAGVLRRARAASKPVAALAGVIEGERADYLGAEGFVDLITLVDAQTTSEQALQDAGTLVRKRTSELIRRLNG
jgi:glycerate 2-kinase